MDDPEWLVELETCRERLAAAKSDLELAKLHAARLADEGMMDGERAVLAEVRAERLAAALEHVRGHLHGVECREYHAGLNDGRHPSLLLLQIIEPALAADAAGDAHA